MEQGACWTKIVDGGRQRHLGFCGGLGPLKTNKTQIGIKDEHRSFISGESSKTSGV